MSEADSNVSRGNPASLVHWSPGADTLVALATVFAFVGVYTANLMIGPARRVAHLVLFVMVGSLFLNVLFPAWYVLRVRRETLRNLGITTDHWIAALGLSALLAVFYLPRLLDLAAHYPAARMAPELVFNGIILWEPFFLFGWLQLRFEGAFGVLPAILLTGICFASYHAPALGLAYASNILVAGVLFATVFRLTCNLLSMFPLTWMVASTVGTLTGHMLFGWTIVAAYIVVLAIQVAAIAWLASTVPVRQIAT